MKKKKNEKKKTLVTMSDGYIPVNHSDSNSFLWLLNSCTGVTENNETESTLSSSSDESVDFVSRTVLMAVENVIYIGVLPVLVMIGIITNVINMLVFARQGLADRINVCLFR